FRTYYYAMRKKRKTTLKDYKKTYKECLSLNINLNTLLCKNLFIEYRKDLSCNAASKQLSEGKGRSPWETVSNKQTSY
ncbi:MAG: hypothetical protein M8357_05790, partial [Desulfobulbaceae bacterium]|nr:hypothetical protein [Desulfobulbaceae bacterium]